MSNFGQWFKGLRGRLVAMIVIAVVSLTVVIFFGYRNLTSVSEALKVASNDRLPTVSAVGEMRSGMQGIARYLWSAYAETTPEGRKPRLEDVNNYIKQFETGMDEWKAVGHIGRNLELFKDVEQNFKDVLSGVREVVADLEKNTPEGNKAAYEANTKRVRPYLATLRTALREINKNVKDAAKKEATEANSGAESAIKLLFGIGLVAIFGTLLLGFFVASKLAAALTVVTKSIHDSSTQVASASAQISTSSQQLAATSSEQASAVEETSASLQEMSGMVENNVRNAEQGLEGVNAVIVNTQEGNESMTSLRSSMSDILDSNKKIEKLVKVIEEIGDKTAIIDEIVFQTKLLSFNASVEAERAGEHGRGFAVVAQEVGNLAQMSGKAALEISSIVKASTKEAQEIATDNREKVEKGGMLVENTAKILANIEKGAKDVLNGSTHIVSSSKEQAAGIKQITNAMDNINKATQETASTSEESAGAGEELSSQARNLDSLVLELTKIVTGDFGADNNGGRHDYANENEAFSHAHNGHKTKTHTPAKVAARRTGGSHGNVVRLNKPAPKQQHESGSEPMKLAAGAEGSAAAGGGWDKL